MSYKVNYTDDIFYINSLIKLLREGLALNLDEDYFLDKTVEDIFFVDSILERIFSSLKEAENLVQRKSYLKELMRAQKQFVNLLEDICTNKFAMSELVSHFFEKFRHSSDIHSDNIREIQTLLTAKSSTPSREYMISQEEYLFLLQDDEENEEDT